MIDGWKCVCGVCDCDWVFCWWCCGVVERVRGEREFDVVARVRCGGGVWICVLRIVV